VYVLHDDRPLSAYRPDPSEVIGLATFRVDELIGLAAGRAESIAAKAAVDVLPDGSLEATWVTLERDNLVPYSADRLARNLGRADRVDTL
jgi:hypothetical protein